MGQDRLVGKRVGSDLMLYDGDLDALHILNPTAQVIYELHGKGWAPEAIARELEARFQVPPGLDPVDDVRATLRDLEAQDLLGGGASV